MIQTIQLKRGLSANLSSVVLAAGEAAFTTDTKKLYIGDGTNKILINPDGGTASTADKLTTPRAISFTGGATGSGSFDGSADLAINLTIAAIALENVTGAGTAASKDVGTSAGQVPVLDASGKLDINTLPAIAITDTFQPASETEMLALTAQRGDIAIRTDLSKTFILKADDATVIANWVELKTPTDVVQSVNGKTGAITLTASDLGLGNVTNESKVTMFTSPTFTGTPVAPTATAGTNTTQVATTAFVMTAISNIGVVDGGTF
jgi:hypothetical protein